MTYSHLTCLVRLLYNYKVFFKVFFTSQLLRLMSQAMLQVGGDESTLAAKMLGGRSL